MARRRSPGLERADVLRDVAQLLKDRADRAGNTRAAEEFDHALTCSFNSRNGYEAAQIVDTGGSSRAFSLRKRGAKWLKDGRAHIAKGREFLGESGGDALVDGGAK